MGVMRDVEISWEDLLEAFENTDSHTVYFLDRESGEVFSVPDDYEDGSFWEEVEFQEDRYLPVPSFDVEQERALLNEFIKVTTDENLKELIEKGLFGRLPAGQLDEILSFYPEEKERLYALKEEMVTARIKQWLEEKDIFFTEEAF